MDAQPTTPADIARLIRVEEAIKGMADVQREFYEEFRRDKHDQNNRLQVNERKIERVEEALFGNPDDKRSVGIVAQIGDIKDAILTARVSWRVTVFIGSAFATLVGGVWAFASYFGLHISLKN